MRQTITCPKCTSVLGIPKEGFPAGGLTCNWCGELIAAPEVVNTKPDEGAPKKPSRSDESQTKELPPPPSQKKPKAPLHKHAETDDDDGTPYELPPEEIKVRQCEECGKDIEVNSVICIHCGHDTRTSEKTSRTFQLIDKSWNSGWPFKVRWGLFLGCLGLDALSIVLSIIFKSPLGASIGGVIFYVSLQAFLLGTFESHRLRRNRKGKVEILSTWKICFIPMQPKKVDWKRNEGITFGVYNDSTMLDWLTCIGLFLCCGIIGGILFFIFVIQKDKYFSALTRDLGYPETYIYRGLNEILAKEITQLTSDATGLPLANRLD